MEVANQLWLGDSMEMLGDVPPASIHLTVTSPPFDATFNYGTPYRHGDWLPLIDELWHATIPGGVVAWQVRNQIHDRAESCSAERQVLDFVARGWRKNFTIYASSNIGRPNSGDLYYRCITPIYVFSKGRPRRLPLLRDRPNKYRGTTSRWVFRLTDGSINPQSRNPHKVAEFGRRSDLWHYNSGWNKTFSEKWLADANHGGIMHLQLARDLIRAYSRPGELILDPYGGTGTTATASIHEGRKYLSIEREGRFHKLAVRRVREARRRRLAEILAEF
jgi:DNA methylase